MALTDERGVERQGIEVWHEVWNKYRLVTEFTVRNSLMWLAVEERTREKYPSTENERCRTIRDLLRAGF